mmetsp:Transcript_89484/g.253553  ORF Transcript_89484/g.253553 Transcript_89484/m.253553 type:complete len:263 (-) Transcript_89484:1707-2495(-)
MLSRHAQSPLRTAHSPACCTRRSASIYVEEVDKRHVAAAPLRPAELAHLLLDRRVGAALRARPVTLLAGQEARRVVFGVVHDPLEVIVVLRVFVLLRVGPGPQPLHVDARRLQRVDERGLVTGAAHAPVEQRTALQPPHLRRQRQGRAPVRVRHVEVQALHDEAPKLVQVVLRHRRPDGRQGNLVVRAAARAYERATVRVHPQAVLHEIGETPAPPPRGIPAEQLNDCTLLDVAPEVRVRRRRGSDHDAVGHDNVARADFRR